MQPYNVLVIFLWRKWPQKAQQPRAPRSHLAPQMAKRMDSRNRDRISWSVFLASFLGKRNESSQSSDGPQGADSKLILTARPPAFLTTPILAFGGGWPV